jgi:hypothetical protein
MSHLLADAVATFNLLTAFGSHGITTAYATARGTETDMADEPEDPDAAADRLEAALERIARLAAVQPAAVQSAPLDSDLSVAEIAERLDSLIGRLRAALGKPE